MPTARPLACFCVASLSLACASSAESPADKKPAARFNTSAIDHESTRQRLERLVEVPGRSSSDLEFALTRQAYGGLLKLGTAGFDDFVSCVDDPRPVWPWFQEQTAVRTTLGDACLTFITEHVDALYLKKEGLGVVTKSNVREWWAARRGASLADLQIETLAAYRETIKTRAEAAQPEVRGHLEASVLPDLARRIEKARRERGAGQPLTLDRQAH